MKDSCCRVVVGEPLTGRIDSVHLPAPPVYLPGVGDERRAEFPPAGYVFSSSSRSFASSRPFLAVFVAEHGSPSRSSVSPGPSESAVLRSHRPPVCRSQQPLSWPKAL